MLARWLPASIQGRLRLLLATVFAVGGSVAMVAAWFFSTAAATDAYDRLLISAAAQISEAISLEHGRFAVLPPDSAFETLAQSKGDRFFLAVRAPDGSLLTGHPALLPDPAERLEVAPKLGFRRFAGAEMRTVTIRRLIASPTAKGWCSVIVAQSLDARNQLVLRLMLKIGAIILFVGALGFAASLGAVRLALRPFDRIGQAIAARRAQDLHPLDVDSPRETQPLIEAINAALARLNERMVALQNFAGLAAHQIRTPLAVIGAQTELILTDKTPKARLARVERLRAHLSKLSRLTHQLLGQAMVSYRTERIPHERVDLAELVGQALRDAVPESLDRDLAVDFDARLEPVLVSGDGIILREALVNLISNAVTHGARSLIRIRIDLASETVSVRIADDGPGLAEALWDDALQPFSIPRDKGDGAGLGLSIATHVARAHGGSLGFGRTADGLFEISLILPRGLESGESA